MSPLDWCVFLRWHEHANDEVGRKYQRRINREMTILGLQAIANEIQSRYDSREMTHAEACEFRNQIQHRADSVDGSQLVYAISDRDAYRRLIEVYLDDGILSRTEQILLWDERRKLGISENVHRRLLDALVARYPQARQAVHVQSSTRRKVEPEEKVAHQEGNDGTNNWLDCGFSCRCCSCLAGFAITWVRRNELVRQSSELWRWTILT